MSSSGAVGRSTLAEREALLMKARDQLFKDASPEFKGHLMAVITKDTADYLIRFWSKLDDNQLKVDLEILVHDRLTEVAKPARHAANGKAVKGKAHIKLQVIEELVDEPAVRENVV